MTDTDRPAAEDEQARRDALSVDAAWRSGYAAGRAAAMRDRPAPAGDERAAVATELLDAVEALLSSEPKSYWLRGPAVRRLREAYNAVVKEANTGVTLDPRPAGLHHHDVNGVALWFDANGQIVGGPEDD